MSRQVPARRLGLIGDIHCEDAALRCALDVLRREGVDRLLAVGDVMDGHGDVERCCALLEDAGVDVVAGNHDRWMRDSARKSPAGQVSENVRAFLHLLPSTRAYQTVNGPLLLCHGVGENDMQRLTPHDYGYALEANDSLQQLLQQRYYRYLVGGHTHRRMVRSFGGLTVINPGTLAREDGPGFALADFAQGVVRFYSLSEAAEVIDVTEAALEGDFS